MLDINDTPTMSLTSSAVLIQNRFSGLEPEIEKPPEPPETPVGPENNKKRKDLDSSPNSPEQGPKRATVTVSTEDNTSISNLNQDVEMISNSIPDNLLNATVSNTTNNSHLPVPDNKWHIVIHTTNGTLLDTSKLDVAIHELCPNIVVLNSLRTKSRLSVFYRTQSPVADFNAIFKNKPEICKRVGSTLAIDPWKIDGARHKSVESEPKHVIVRDVPIDYSNAEILHRIDPDLSKNIESVGRINSPKNNKPAPIIRVICKTEDFAQQLVNNGLLIGNRKLSCEAANPRYNPLQCFRCSRYNHHSAECPNIECCSVCGYEHRTSECQNKRNRREHYCINCNNTSHSARDRTCPVYREEVRKLKQKELIKNKKLLSRNGIIDLNSAQVRPGTSWAQVVSSENNGNDIHSAIDQQICKSTDRIINKLEDSQSGLEEKINEKCLDLKLEIEMNRSSNNVLLEKSKNEMQTILDEHKQHILAEVQKMLNNTKLELVTEMLKMTTTEAYSQTHSRIVYHQVKNAMRSQSLPRDAESAHHQNTQVANFKMNSATFTPPAQGRTSTSTLPIPQRQTKKSKKEEVTAGNV